MGHKVSPISFRITFNKRWMSRWFNLKNYKEMLEEDMIIRDFLEKKLKNMSVDRVEIEKSPDRISVIIFTARPGLIIGRGGAGVEDVKKELAKRIKRKIQVKIDIQEYKNPETSAKIMAESIAEQIERRLPFRRVLKQTLSKIMAGNNVFGAKVQVSGRLNGAEIARTEHLEEGKLPLQTLRADINYAEVTARTTYGAIGVKCWVYRGEVFEKETSDDDLSSVSQG